MRVQYILRLLWTTVFWGCMRCQYSSRSVLNHVIFPATPFGMASDPLQYVTD